MTWLEFTIQLLNSYLPIVLAVSALVWGIVNKFEKEIRDKLHGIEEAPGWKFSKPIDEKTSIMLEENKNEKSLDEMQVEFGPPITEEKEQEMIKGYRDVLDKKEYWLNKYLEEVLGEGEINLIYSLDRSSHGISYMGEHPYSSVQYLFFKTLKRYGLMQHAYSKRIIDGEEVWGHEWDFTQDEFREAYLSGKIHDFIELTNAGISFHNQRIPF